jgi:hypothetical protein
VFGGFSWREVDAGGTTTIIEARGARGLVEEGGCRIDDVATAKGGGGETETAESGAPLNFPRAVTLEP